MEKGIKNVNAVAHKFKSASIRVTILKLKVDIDKKPKIEEIIERRKAKALVEK